MTPRLWAWPIVMLFLAAATVYAAEGEEDDLAAELNAAITRDEGPGAQIAGAFQDVSGLDLSLIADVGWAAFTTGDRYRMGGHSFRENGPFVQNIELAASANVDPYFRFDLNHSFTHGHIEEGVISTTSLPWVKFRLGQFKTDLGRVNPTHLHTWNFVDQPLAIEWLFGGEGMALPGAEFSLLFPLPWYAEFVFASQKGQVVSMDAATVLQADDLIYSSRLKQFVEISDALGLFFSANGAQGPSAIGPEENFTYLYGGDLFLKYRPLGFGQTGHFFVALTVEGWLRQMEVPRDVWEDGTGYAELDLGLAKRWSTAGRFDVFRRLSGDEPGAVNRRTDYGIDSHRYNASVSFAPSHFSRLRLNYSLHQITEETVKDNFEDNHMVAFQLEVAVGKHGAHPY